MEVILEWGGPQTNTTNVLIKKGNLDTDIHVKRTPCEDGGRYWGDPSISSEMPKVASKPPEARGQPWDTFSLTTSEGTDPTNTLMLAFQPPELQDDTFLLLKAPLCGYGSPSR